MSDFLDEVVTRGEALVARMMESQQRSQELLAGTTMDPISAAILAGEAHDEAAAGLMVAQLSDALVAMKTGRSDAG